MAPMPVEGARPFQFQEHFADGRPAQDITRALAEEAPVAIEINGLGYAVMMATPTDLQDYALGFCLSEQLIASVDEFMSADAAPVEAGGWMLRVQLAASGAGPLLERARLRLSEGSCGLCGIESLEQVMRPLLPVTAKLEVSPAALFRAVEALGDQQVLGQATRAAHAAALCAPDGTILLVREDVGRHNAFDKLLGAAARAGLDPTKHFVLLTARCSFELVQKAVIAGVPLLATVSAASTLAVEQAAAHGLRLVSLTRRDSLLES
ncbi:MAG: sulfurtransferase FdhD [Novosphingobium sp. 16-62-11]|uniref:formate dehydrogenase accessory sulfurtransferase FdhD n=1 Tax=Novosphingobium sp. 17-62-19 TaxID=1970406 RepID=UPI000BC5B73C|nr:formate dehydrogenase accessory sulfurtransferase FdhD [Novosphingobium sp. 17-62-19]OYX95009.1 MAG: sulfurtransferase FdhD [Novosphingobium sp. 35-62-5]OYZ44420.1 MAG: sulfurtransferase FdhD [Novosphingobium sp. 16-62-11]OZA71205.1 MAG: sulfurtransferase FdhD [Sphingomonadales bacterium 39-62-4]HQS95150.1 formate dehydrogenase accessory sulfurtransferase FdhD [Novosphingobium sp.]OZA21546.1 MAG: sulfurtransferase FdhD [Novosphingobium sp. 17-62-19]